LISTEEIITLSLLFLLYNDLLIGALDGIVDIKCTTSLNGEIITNVAIFVVVECIEALFLVRRECERERSGVGKREPAEQQSTGGEQNGSHCVCVVDVLYYTILYYTILYYSVVVELMCVCCPVLQLLPLFFDCPVRV
jgi:hypothetical protein